MAAFVVPTMVCGLWLLPALVHDAGARWGVASALGAAVAAVSVLWGQSFATPPGGGGATGSGPARSVQASGQRAVAVGGPVKGNISTGDVGVPRTSSAAAGQTSGGATTPSPEPSVPSEPQGGSHQGLVAASGERSVALGDAMDGDIATGDRQ